MNIVVDSCSYNCQNVGDLAMLTVAVSRLRDLWPLASIRVITNAPERVAHQCGAIETVPVRGRRLLLRERLLGPGRRWLPGAVAGPWDRFEGRLRLRRPGLFDASLRTKAALRRGRVADAGAFLSAIDDADLVVVNGAGIMTDAFRENALGVLATLELANRRGVPTALFGQGLGPIEGDELRRRAAEVLPSAALIGVRESRSGVPLLASLGVDPARVHVTGDDAIELAFGALRRRRACGDQRQPKIGINVRVASYADVAQDTLCTLRGALEEAARTYGARMVPIPIAHHGGHMDVDALRELLDGQDDGGSALATPELVIDAIGGCRIMVTGSYHGAVFALAQGIPVVALAKSSYYMDKMTGLADQFGVGCDVVRLDQRNVSTRLRAAIDLAWSDADRVSPPLLRAAAAQIERGRAAYTLLRDSVMSRQAR